MATSIKVKVKERLKPILEDETLRKRFTSIIEAAGNIIVREYKKEAPVDKGDLRTDVKMLSRLNRQDRFNGVVTTTATNRGKPYPVYVHRGKGRFRGGRDRGRGNYTRQAGYTDADIAMFAAMAARGYRFDVRPNKFAKRAEEEARPKVDRFLRKEINNLINE